MIKLPLTQLLTAQSALDTKAAAVIAGTGSAEWIFYVLFGAGTTAGVVVVESAHDPNYTGTWATVATLSWAAANRVHYAAITGIHHALRVRISTAIVGGTVNAWVVGGS